MVTVAIYGGGIGGLSAAHELVKRGFDVDLYEASDGVGGKARSQFIANTGSDGRLDLPGEHGFRFFPAFYLHLDETMRDIPTANGKTVFDALEPTTEFAIAKSGGVISRLARRIKPDITSLPNLWKTASLWFDRDGLRMNAADMGNLLGALLRMWTSCEDRRQGQHDNVSWYDFAGAGARSAEYQRLTSALPRTMVAMDGRHGSAYTIGKVASQLFLFDLGRPELDRVLNGPTSSSWLGPWEAHLRKQNVRIHLNAKLRRLNVKDGRIVSGDVQGVGQVKAHYHICALPIEVMRNVIIDDELAAAAPSLAAVRRDMTNSVDWMVGAQFFIDRQLDLCKGHVIYTDSPWALSSISQPQFWQADNHKPFHHRYGDGRTRDLLSVDISDWATVAPRVGRVARHCDRKTILNEVFNQLLDAINARGETHLTASNLVHAHLDDNIRYDANTSTCSNRTPLLVHRPGHWKLRPDALTNVDNLLIASDYVRTHTNLASMEGANEAARRAVRGIMVKSGRGGIPPEVFEMKEPDLLDPFKALDKWWFNLSGQRNPDHIFDLDDEARLAALRRARTEGVPLEPIKNALAGGLRRFNKNGEEEVARDLENLQDALDQLL